MASTDDLPTVPPGDPRDRQAADETPVQPNRWRVRLICCGRDDGTREAASWEEADAFREAYTSGPGVKTSPTQTSGHERAAIIEKIDPDQPDGEPLTWSLAAEMVREDAIAAEERRIELAEREGRAYDQPHVAPGPDVDAGGAGDEVYRQSARAALAVNHEGEPGAYAVMSLAHDPAHRAAIDEARAPLLAELASDRRAYLAQVERLIRERDQARAELAEAIRERDEARAKTNGGEWQWGVRWTTARKPVDWLGGDEADVRRYVAARPAGTAELVRRWIGPVGPVTDDGSAT